MENNLISKKTFVIPVLALQNGKRIKFKQNSYEIIHLDSEEAISDSVEYFSIWDSFFIFDLDGFNNEGNNKNLIFPIIKRHNVIVGGGINNISLGLEYLNNGAEKIVLEYEKEINEEDQLLYEKINKEIPKERRIDMIKIKGGNGNMKEIFIKINILQKYSHHILLVFNGSNVESEFDELINQLHNNLPNIIFSVMSPFVNNTAIIEKLTSIGISSFLTHMDKLTFGDICSSVINYSKLSKFQGTKDNTIPTIIPLYIIKNFNYPLGLTFTSRECLIESINRRVCVFYSRDRKKKWVKGESSGHYHYITNISVSCDRCCVLFNVKGDRFCHVNFDSCFHNRQMIRSLRDIEMIFNEKTNKEKDILSDILYNLQENTSQRGINENIGNIVVNIINFLNLKGISVDEVLTEIDKKEKRIINGSDRQHIKYLLNKKNTIKEKKLDKIKFCICLGNITDFELNNFKALIEKNENKHFIVNKVPLYDDVTHLILHEQIDGIIVYEDYVMNNKILLDNHNLIKYTKTEIQFLNNAKSLSVLSCYKDLSPNKLYKLITTNYFFSKQWIKSKSTIEAEIINVNDDDLCFTYLINGLCDIAIFEYNEDNVNVDNLFILDKNITIFKEIIMIKEEKKQLLDDILK